VRRGTAAGNANSVSVSWNGRRAADATSPGRAGSSMVRILVDGEGSRAVELCIRAALGDRSDDEQWLITAVRLPARWVVSFLVSPHDRLAGYTWCGPAHEVRGAVQEALRSAGLAAAALPSPSLVAAF
jgi:hypothetical protein